MATFTYNAAAWTVDQRQQVIGPVVRLLADAGITHGGVTRQSVGTDEVVEVVTPSADPTSALAQAAVKAKWQEQATVRAAQDAANQALQAARLVELSANVFKGMTKADINARFDGHVAALDAAGSLQQAKDALRPALRDMERIALLLWARAIASE